jgi:homocitrate synthase
MIFDVIDTTFREGQQSPLLFDQYKYCYSLSDKKKLFTALVKLGVRRFELFSPIVSLREEKDFYHLKNIQKLNNWQVKFFAHCRINEGDIFSAIKAGFDGLNLYLNLSETGKQSYSVKQKELIEKAVFLIKNIRKKFAKLYLRFSGEDGFRTPTKRIFYVFDKLYQYVDAFGLPDTVGVASPELVTRRIKLLRKRYPKVLLEVHFHNDRGFSLINALTAVKTGAQLVDTTVWGLGERSGITSITGLLLNLYLEKPDFVEKFNLNLCHSLNVLMAEIIGVRVPYNEPVSLTNRTHIAGVHQKAVMRHHQVYEGTNLEKFGVNKNQILLGPLSGANLIYYFLKEVKGCQLGFDEAKAIAKEFKDKFDSTQNPEFFLLSLVKQMNIKKTNGSDNYSYRSVAFLNQHDNS